MTEEKERRFSPFATGALAVFCCVMGFTGVVLANLTGEGMDFRASGKGNADRLVLDQLCDTVFIINVLV